MRYEAASAHCSGHAQPGTVALRDYVLRFFDLEDHEVELGDLGIYACRPVRGGSSPSVHGDGRAWDARTPVVDGGHDEGWRLARWAVEHHVALGVQQAIFARRMWTLRDTIPQWRPYLGDHPHYDHVHIEQTWDAALTLTVDEIARLVAPPEPDIEEDPVWLITAGDGPVYATDLGSWRRHLTADEKNRLEFLGVVKNPGKPITMSVDDVRAIPVVGRTYPKTHPDLR